MQLSHLTKWRLPELKLDFKKNRPSTPTLAWAGYHLLSSLWIASHIHSETHFDDFPLFSAITFLSIEILLAIFLFAITTFAISLVKYPRSGLPSLTYALLIVPILEHIFWYASFFGRTVPLLAIGFWGLYVSFRERKEKRERRKRSLPLHQPEVLELQSLCRFDKKISTEKSEKREEVLKKEFKKELRQTEAQNQGRLGNGWGMMTPSGEFNGGQQEREPEPEQKKGGVFGIVIGGWKPGKGKKKEF